MICICQSEHNFITKNDMCKVYLRMFALPVSEICQIFENHLALPLQPDDNILPIDTFLSCNLFIFKKRSQIAI